MTRSANKPGSVLSARGLQEGQVEPWRRRKVFGVTFLLTEPVCFYLRLGSAAVSTDSRWRRAPTSRGAAGRTTSRWRRAGTRRGAAVRTACPRRADQTTPSAPISCDKPVSTRHPASGTGGKLVSRATWERGCGSVWGEYGLPWWRRRSCCSSCDGITASACAMGQL